MDYCLINKLVLNYCPFWITCNRSGGQIIKIEIKDEPIDDLSDDPEDSQNKTVLSSKPGMSTQNPQPTIKKETLDLGVYIFH